VDTAPIGTVADNFSLTAVADATLLLVRHGKTNRNHLQAVLTDMQATEINGVALLLNDYSANGSAYRYAYNYRYEQKGRKKDS
jgi:hypothetical protein